MAAAAKWAGTALVRAGVWLYHRCMPCSRIILWLGVLSVGCNGVRPLVTPEGPHFTILTYNVNWGAPRPELAVEVLRQADADIVCLQETTRQWAAYLQAELSQRYPAMVFRESEYRAAGGLAFLSKRRGDEVAYIRSNTTWFDGWIMAFDTPAGRVQVLNVHLQPPVNDRGSVGASGYLASGDRRKREIIRFCQHRQAGVPMLIAGDFNEAERGPALAWLAGNGMVNALPQFDRATPTWRWRWGPVNLRRRMDHIVYSADLCCYGAQVLRAGASDHLPVQAVFGRR